MLSRVEKIRLSYKILEEILQNRLARIFHDILQEIFQDSLQDSCQDVLTGFFQDNTRSYKINNSLVPGSLVYGKQRGCLQPKINNLW